MKELWWLLCPVCAVLWQLGGHYYKTIRREGVPLVIFLSGIMAVGFSWQLLLSCGLLWCAVRLPFTLVGDSLNAFWGNWLWIWLAGYLLGMASFPLSQSLLLPLVPMLAEGLLGSLSNIPYTSRFLPWKFVEGAIRFSVAYPWALAFSS